MRRSIFDSEKIVRNSIFEEIQISSKNYERKIRKMLKSKQSNQLKTKLKFQIGLININNVLNNMYINNEEIIKPKNKSNFILNQSLSDRLLSIPNLENTKYLKIIEIVLEEYKVIISYKFI